MEWSLIALCEVWDLENRCWLWRWEDSAESTRRCDYLSLVFHSLFCLALCCGTYRTLVVSGTSHEDTSLVGCQAMSGHHTLSHRLIHTYGKCNISSAPTGMLLKCRKKTEARVNLMKNVGNATETITPARHWTRDPGAVRLPSWVPSLVWLCFFKSVLPAGFWKISITSHYLLLVLMKLLPCLSSTFSTSDSSSTAILYPLQPRTRSPVVFMS